MTTLTRGIAAGSIVLLSGLLAACGDDSESKSDPNAIVIVSAAPLKSPAYQVPEYAAGLKAAVASINANGGVGGHQLELSVCDSTFSVNGELGCTREMVAKKPSAIVAPFFVADQTGAVWKVLDKAGIPVVGGQGGSVPEMNSPVVFPLGSAFMGPYQGAAQGIVDADAQNVVVLVDSPNPAGEFATELISTALSDRGVGKVRTVTAYPASDPTFATAAADTIGGGTDGVVLDATPVNNAKLIKALRDGGYTGDIAVPSLLLPAQSIKALGADAEGVILDSTTAFIDDETNQGIAAFKADMAKYQPDADVNDASLQAWSGVQLFAKAAETASKYDAASLLTALEDISDPIDIKTAGPWSVKGKLNSIEGFSRLINPTVTYGVIRDGVVVPQGDGFKNPFVPAG